MLNITVVSCLNNEEFLNINLETGILGNFLTIDDCKLIVKEKIKEFPEDVKEIQVIQKYYLCEKFCNEKMYKYKVHKRVPYELLWEKK